MATSVEEQKMRTRLSLSKQLLLLAGLFALAIVLQFFNGAFSSEFGAYPDEPAHYVTSLMLREYITGLHPLSPLHFAEEYYRHYPKVAFGHWPPVFYIAQAFWMILFSASRISVRLEIAFTTALLAFSFWRVAARWFATNAVVLGAILLVCLPLVQNSTDEEMAECLLTLFCFWSSVYFGRFLDSGKRSDSLWFALYASLAVLTKGSGWLLVFIPPVSILLTRKFRLLVRAPFWMGVVLIGVLCLPWQLLTLHSAERGWTGGSHPSVGYTVQALGQFLLILVSVMGPVLSLVVALGIAVSIWLILKKRIDATPAVMLALLLGDWIFHSLVPAGVESRKMILAVPALIYFLLVGVYWLAGRLPLPASIRSRQILLAATLAAIFAFTVFSVPKSSRYGYVPAAGFIASHSELQNRILLVSSQSGGEGLLISELAMRQPRPKDVILRATKEFAQVDWTGEHYRSLVKQPADVLAYLASHNVSVVVTDSNHAMISFAHQQILESAIRSNPQRFRLAAEFPGDSEKKGLGKVQIYLLR